MSIEVQFSDQPPAGAVVLFDQSKGRYPLSSENKKIFSQSLASQRALRKAELYDLEKSEVFAFTDRRPGQLFIVHLGAGPLDFRSLGAKLGKKLLRLERETCALALPSKENHPLYKGFEGFLEGLLLGLYRYQEFKSPSEKPKKELRQLTLVGAKTKALQSALQRARILAESTCLARDLGNRPGNHFTPSDFKKACEQVAQETGMGFEALDEKAMKQEKMGCLLGVSQGSDEPAWLNILSYRCGDKKAPTLLWVGKGLTFDSGGISLKPAVKMEEMKFDMLGGGAVLGAMRAVALLKPEVNIIGIIPASENLPGPRANKPGDVLTACNGTTVEVINTDAEGRLILADALAYGVKRFQPEAVIDLATLTGACVVALGHYHTGLLSNDQALTRKLQAAADQSGDWVWELPTHEIYEKQIKGEVADLKNIGGPDGGTITAGLFLKHFIEKTPWAHLDIAGTGWNAERIDYYPPKGATGTGVRLLAELAMAWK